ncbi:hypothetical protein O181_009612 [Austropuccinia psidii MF-1]|uniref:Uncharacterized protein n=1 Tax=Austropuccinia psidii MF-1 TaxID=1389203 RepID=A0A9Q3BR28_9BASI|nr:hypothetical protein [Austropuccinia psidii MF-1]
MLEKESHNANRCIQFSFEYAKERWEKSHKPPDFKGEDLVLVSTLKLNNIKGPKELTYSFASTLMIGEINFLNDIQLELTGEVMKKHPKSTVSLIKPYSSSEKELFPLRNKAPLEAHPLEEEEENKIEKVLK